MDQFDVVGQAAKNFDELTMKNSLMPQMPTMNSMPHPQNAQAPQFPMNLNQGVPQQAMPVPPIIELLKNLPDKEEEVSLDTLKKNEIKKIMESFDRGKKIANNHYTSHIQPKLVEREHIYDADKAHYKQKFPILSESSEWCSKDVKTTIDWILPSLIEVFTGAENPVSIAGVNVEDDEGANKVQQLLKYQLERKNQYFTLLISVLTSALKVNLGVVKVSWHREEDRKKVQMLLEGNELETVNQLFLAAQSGELDNLALEALEEAPDLVKCEFDVIKLIENYPKIEYMSPSELRFTPEEADLRECKFVAHRKIVNGDYLMRKEKDGIFKNVKKAIEKAGNTTYTSYDDKTKQLDLVNRNQLSDSDDASKQVELYEAYLRVDYNNDGIYEDLIIHAVDDVPLRISENKYGRPPFFTCAACFDPHEVFGKESFADNLEQLQDLKTAVIRQVIINTAKNNAPRQFIDERTVDMDALLAGDEFVPVNGDLSASIFSPPPLPISPLTMNLVEYAQGEIEAQSGTNRYSQGITADNMNRTATGVSAIMGAAEKKIKLLTQQISENFLIPLFKFLIQLNKKFMDSRQVVRLMNENFVVTRDDLDVDFDLIVSTGEGVGTKEAQINYLMILINQLYPQLAQLGLVTERSWYQVTKTLLEKMGLRAVGQYVLDPSGTEFQTRQQQAQLAQAQQAQMESQKATELLNLQKQIAEEEIMAGVVKTAVSSAMPKVSTKLETLSPFEQAALMADRRKMLEDILRVGGEMVVRSTQGQDQQLQGQQTAQAVPAGQG